MKKYGLRILVGLFAFLIGLSVGFWKLNQSILIPQISVEEPTKTEGSDLIKSGNIKFVFKNFTEDSIHAEFVLINGTAKDIHYIGYGGGSYCTVDYKQKGQIKMSPACCGTGLEKQTLKAGNQQIFTVFLFDWEDVNQVGFKTFDENNKSFVVWSDKF